MYDDDDDDDDGGGDDEQRVTLNPSVALKVLQHAADARDGGRLRLSQGAVAVTAELLRLFVASARARAEAEAKAEGDDAIRPEHVEAALAELLADF